MKRIVLFVMTFSALTTIPATAQETVCPETIEVREKLEKRMPKWETLQEDVPHRLMSVRFFEGHPKKMVEITPISDVSFKGESVTKWQFQSSNPLQYYISCGYDRTTIMLTQVLNANITACEIAYDDKITISGHSLVKAIKCTASASKPETKNGK